MNFANIYWFQITPDKLNIFEAVFKTIEAALLGLRESTGARNANVDTRKKICIIGMSA